MINIFLKIPIFRKIIFILADSNNLILSLLISNWFLKYNFDLIEIYFYTLPISLLIYIYTSTLGSLLDMIKAFALILGVNKLHLSK